MAKIIFKLRRRWSEQKTERERERESVRKSEREAVNETERERDERLLEAWLLLLLR